MLLNEMNRFLKRFRVNTCVLRVKGYAYFLVSVVSDGNISTWILYALHIQDSMIIKSRQQRVQCTENGMNQEDGNVLLRKSNNNKKITQCLDLLEDLRISVQKVLQDRSNVIIIKVYSLNRSVPERNLWKFEVGKKGSLCQKLIKFQSSIQSSPQLLVKCSI